MANAILTSDTIAPKMLILPLSDSSSATMNKVSGAIFVSGGNILWWNGSAFMTITDA